MSPRTLALLVLAGCCVCVLSLRGRGAAAAPGGGRLGADVHLPSLPVFVINGPEEYAARKWVEQQLASVGVTRYERINGVVVEADDCMRLSGEGCQQGLALAHLSAWRRIVARQLPVALVVEDDVTWHRDFAALLPRYLAQAPSVRGPAVSAAAFEAACAPTEQPACVLLLPTRTGKSFGSASCAVRAWEPPSHPSRCTL